MTKTQQKIRTLDDLNAVVERGKAFLYPSRPKILVGMATCGQAAGANEVLEAIQAVVKAEKLPFIVAETGCIGWCSQEPLVDVYVPGHPRVTYGRVKPGRAKEIVHAIPTDRKAEWALAYMPGDDNVLTDSFTEYGKPNGDLKGVSAYKELPLFQHQLRIVMRNCGLIDPDSLDEYIARGGYQALFQALRSMKPEEALNEVMTSGLRGRGG